MATESNSTISTYYQNTYTSPFSYLLYNNT